MRPTRIKQVLDIALRARELGLVWNPMFVGEAGLGKSQICQEWQGEKDEEFKDDGGFGILDIRIAYYEGPDLVGLPEVFEVNGVKRTIYAIPEIFPTEGRGIILLEEPNRGNNMIQNCLMQILTDRQIGPHFKLPEGWIIVGCMNPEGGKYDVTAMDAALKDRFEMFDIEYDYQTFMNYVESGQKTGKWSDNVANYIKSGNWVYQTPDRIAEGGKYISPRTWSKLNSAELTGIGEEGSDKTLHRLVCQSILGNHYGQQYYQFCYDDAPILSKDILNDLEGSLAKLKKQSKSGNTYSGDRLHATIESIVEAYGGWYEGRERLDNKGKSEPYPHEEGTIDEATMAAIAKVIPSDMAVGLIKDCGLKTNRSRPDTFFAEFTKRNPDLVSVIRDHLKVRRATK